MSLLVPPAPTAAPSPYASQRPRRAVTLKAAAADEEPALVAVAASPAGASARASSRVRVPVKDEPITSPSAAASARKGRFKKDGMHDDVWVSGWLALSGFFWHIAMHLFSV